MNSIALLMGLVLCAGDSAVQKKFSNIEIEDAFRPYLVSNVLLMEVTGAKVIRLPKKRTVVIAVASTVLKDDSAKERLRAEKVCRVKALASVVAEKQGVQVAHTEELKEETRIIIDEKGETGKSVSDLSSSDQNQSRRNRQGHARHRPLEVQRRRRVLHGNRRELGQKR